MNQKMSESITTNCTRKGLKIDDNTVIEGHDSCAAYLEQSVHQLLEFPPVLDAAAQEVLPSEVVPVFTAADNALLLKIPSKEEVFKTLSEANLHAAPGCDGLTSFLYK